MTSSTEAVHARFDRIVEAFADKLPGVASTSKTALADMCVHRLPEGSGARSNSTTPPSDSTVRSVDAPTSSTSSPNAAPPSA
jgi:hypothetical protein